MKNKTTAALLAFFLGGFGVHRFYLGRTLSGVMYLLFFWTFIPAIIAFVEFIIFLTMSDDTFNQKYNPMAVQQQQMQQMQMAMMQGQLSQLQQNQAAQTQYSTPLPAPNATQDADSLAV